MAVTSTKCREHPRYKGAQKPRKTKKHPNRCQPCVKVYEAAQSYPIGLQFHCGACNKTIVGDYDLSTYEEYGHTLGIVRAYCTHCPNEYEFEG